MSPIPSGLRGFSTRLEPPSRANSPRQQIQHSSAAGTSSTSEQGEDIKLHGIEYIGESGSSFVHPFSRCKRGKYANWWISLLGVEHSCFWAEMPIWP